MTHSIHFQFCNELVLVTERRKHLIFLSKSWSPRMSFFSFPNPLPLSERNTFHHTNMGYTSTGTALEFIYHTIPLISKNQKTHFPPHPQFGSVPAPAAKESTYGCWMYTVWKEGLLSRINLGNFHSHSPPWTSGGLDASITKKPRSWITFRGHRVWYLQYSDGYHFFTWPRDKVNECQLSGRPL